MERVASRKVGVCLFALLLVSTIAAAQLVTIPHTETHVITSDTNDHEYTVYVALPMGYARSVRRFPVIYVLDGDARLTLTRDILWPMVAEERMQAAIVVGIGYGVVPGDDPEWYDLRARDLSPVRDPQFHASGGGDAFLGFVRDELIPFVNETYRTEPDEAMLMGHSLGGLLVLLAMFTMPEAFSYYVATSPSLLFGNEMMAKEERSYSAENSDLPAKLFISVGGNEGWPANPRLVGQFVDRLESRGYASLEVHYFLMDGESHMSSVPGATARALKTLMPFAEN
jgi:predicted alpha/beta superfamily hydrolase